MRLRTAQLLSKMTTAFYDEVSSSFSQTRSAPWDGWRQVLQAVQSTVPPSRDLRVLDLACGNLRFERFLAEEWRQGRVEAFTVDSCDELASSSDVTGADVHFQHLDVVAALSHGRNLAEALSACDCDLGVSFGFMHHLPLPEQRLRVLEALLACARPGGVVAVSFWQLSKSERLLRKARSTTEAAAHELGLDDLGARDYLLGWQDRTDVVRYCHDFSEEEIDKLVAAVASQADEVARFSADGATHNLNRYLLLRRHG